ncbi:replication protein A 70 kDa DNA-binding subunit B isoform X2 [Arachis duranensis]|uniref:Replication protein A 70 kDa DNA-binding subunit B isoform X2 n=1 Tax=Arachis duranensis TaxID=130453 RepID=A0A9C6TRC7_ARADU|nr:replication protein A 70 kDa DNA-binding subunit B isoform X2 [Arachis duranensis]
MGENYDYISDINARKFCWNFKVYVIRIWEHPSKFNEKEIGSIEMILQDSKGGRGHASIPKSIVKKWSGVFQVFQMYIIKNFIVVDNKTIKKPTPYRWILTFSHRTEVNHVMNPTFPLDAFVFKTIPELLTAEKIENSELFDMIGEVVGKHDPRELVTSKGKETKRLVVVLQDLEKNRINCTLFGEMVDEILPHLEVGRLEPLIVVIQYFKAIRWNGQTSVQSHFEISKLHINAELKDVVGFRDRLLKGAPSNASRISQMSFQSGWSGMEEITNGSALVKTIEEVLSSKEEGPIWVAGTIVAINCSKNDWYYKACRRCPKKVETPVGNKYECDKCGYTHGTASIRYKVEVMVFDGTGSISLLLWDRETSQLCGKQAEKVLEEDICDDEEVVDKNLPKNFDGNSSMNMTENGCSNSLDMFGNITDLNTDTDPDAQYTMDIREDSITSLKCKTPAKRVTNGFRSGSSSAIQNEDEGQLSTNKFSRKNAKKQKSIMIDGEN